MSAKDFDNNVKKNKNVFFYRSEVEMVKILSNNKAKVKRVMSVR
jgi:hypothetical protein